MTTAGQRDNMVQLEVTYPGFVERLLPNQLRFDAVGLAGRRADGPGVAGNTNRLAYGGFGDVRVQREAAVGGLNTRCVFRQVCGGDDPWRGGDFAGLSRHRWNARASLSNEQPQCGKEPPPALAVLHPRCMTCHRAVRVIQDSSGINAVGDTPNISAAPNGIHRSVSAAEAPSAEVHPA